MEFDRPITIAIILFSTLLFAFFLTFPEYSNLKDLEMNLAQKKAEYLAQFEYYSEIANAYATLQTRKEDIQKIDDALPSKPDFGQLVYYYQGKAKDSGLVLRNLALSQTGAGEGVKDITFSLNLSGTYDALSSFIASLENSARMFEIATISFGSSSQASGPATSNASQPVIGSGGGANQFQSSGIFAFSMEIKAHSY
jgi:Tfp pilus assembly protein PilO